MHIRFETAPQMLARELMGFASHNLTYPAARSLIAEIGDPSLLTKQRAYWYANAVVVHSSGHIIGSSPFSIVAHPDGTCELRIRWSEETLWHAIFAWLEDATLDHIPLQLAA